MNEALARRTKAFALACLSLAFILTPLFFLPFTTDFFSFNKQVLFFLLTALALISWLIHSIVTKTVRLTLSPLLLPLCLLPTAAIISLFVNSSNTPDTWINRPSLYLGLAVFYLLFTTLIQSSRQVRKILNFLILIAVILGIWGILSILGVFQSLNLPNYLTLKSFSPLGSLLSLVSFLLVILPLSLVLAFKTRLGPQKLQYFLASGLIISAIILVGYQLFPHQAFAVTLLPKLAGWSIAIDTFKQKALFGAGPGNFVNQFTQFKPLSLNLTDAWAVNFTTSANEYLHLMTTLGLGGLLSLGLLIISWLKLSHRDPGTRITTTQLALNLAVTTALILGLFLPFTATLWIILTGLLSLAVGMNKSKNLTKVKDVLLTINAVTIIEPYTLTPPPKPGTPSGILPWVLAVPSALGLVLATLGISKIYAAEVYFRQSLVALSENQGTNTYNFQVKAIDRLNTIDRYHTAYSNTNLALANSLSSQADLTDQDRQTITQLVQQAIREARTATQLNPQKASNWQNLANIYRNLANFADGADQFAIAAYVKAIQLDPANPRLRLELGGLFYSLQQYDQAVDRFQEAVQLKPDYANAYYNLANGYKQQNKTLEAYQAMQQVVSLISPDSPDAAKAQQELNQLKAQLPQDTNQPSASPQPQQLTQPSPLPQAPEGLEPINLETPQTSPNPSPSPAP